MKRISALFLSLLMVLTFTGCGKDGDSGSKSFLPEATDDYLYTELPGDSSYETTPDQSFSDHTESQLPAEGKYYYDLENVVLYLDTYGTLPDNYITKNEARKLGWEGGTPEPFLAGAAIGGDPFGNREGILPDGEYTECDLNTDGASSRGAERLVFSDDGHYYHTENHYESFTEVWVEDGEVVW